MDAVSVSFRPSSSNVQRQFVVFGKHHLNHLIRNSVTYCNHHRAQSAQERLTPIHHSPDEVETVQLDKVVVSRKSHVDEIVKSFERKAAYKSQITQPILRYSNRRFADVVVSHTTMVPRE